jgi:hypothetical protein
VSKGIATFPSLIFRWQAALDLTNGELVTLGHILGYYRSRGKWPSVSIDAIAKAREVHRGVVDREIAQLEVKGYLVKAGTDARYRTFYYDFSGLLRRLEDFVAVEEGLENLKQQAAALRQRATRTFQHKETETENQIENSSNRTRTQREPKQISTSQKVRAEEENVEMSSFSSQPKRRSQILPSLAEESSSFDTAAECREATERGSQ